MCGSVPGIIWLRCLVQRPQRCFLDVPRRSYRHIWSCSCVWRVKFKFVVGQTRDRTQRQRQMLFRTETITQHTTVALWFRRHTGACDCLGLLLAEAATCPQRSRSSRIQQRLVGPWQHVPVPQWLDIADVILFRLCVQVFTRLPDTWPSSAQCWPVFRIDGSDTGIYDLLALAISLTFHEYTVNIRRTRVAVPDRLLGTLFGLKNKALSLSDFRNQLERLYFSSIVHRADSRRFYSYHAIYTHTQYCIPVLVIIQPTLSRIKRCTPSVCPIDWLIEQGLTSPPTQYRLYGRRFFTGHKTQPTGKAVETSNFVEP